jgi:RHS repeat-associated protein
MARFYSLAPRKRSRPRIICTALVLMAAFLFYGVYAHAAQVTMTITGTLTNATDFAGTFVTPAVYDNLAGKSFTLVFEMDDMQGVPFYGTWPADCDNGLQNSGLNTPVPHAVFTVDGKSYTFGTYPTTSISSSVLSFNATVPQTQLSTRFYQSRFDSSDTSLWGSESAAVNIYLNSIYQCRSWESAFPGGTLGSSYTLVPGKDTYDGGVSVEYSDLNSDVTIVDFVAYFNVATVSVSGPQLPAISGKNNGGGKCQTCPCPAVERNLSLVGDPINAGTGNLFETQTDFTAAPETQLSFTRYYNSFDTSSAGLGVGWHSTYHRGLNVTTPAVTVTRADGRQDIYTKTASGYVPDPDVTNVLTPVPATGTQTGWKLKLADDSTEIYTLAGLLTSITTRAGLTTTLTYNGANQLTTVTGPFGHKLTFTYDTSNRVSTMTVHDGGRFTYGYDVHGNLASVTNPDSTTRFYHYQNTTYPDLLTGLTDESGNLFESWTYDSQGRATSSQHAGGADLTKVTYTNGTGTTVTDARGNVHTYTLATQFNLVKPTAISGVDCGCSSGTGAKAFTYDADGFVSSLTDFDGNVRTYVHNALGEETSRTEASGTALARTITTTWSTAFHLPTKIVEPNRTTTFAYDANGNLLTKSATDGTHTRTWTYTYNTHGQVLTAKDPDNHVTTTTYDAKGDVATIENALNQVSSFTSYDADGKLLSVTDPNGLVTAFTYDPRGRVLTKKVSTLTTSYRYAPPGMVSLVTQPDGSTYRYMYDAAHRLTQIEDKAGDTIDSSYDATSNLAAVNIYDPGKTLTYTHSYTYDAGNRLASETGATSAERTTYIYDNQGNLLTRTDPLGHVSTYTYDALNRRISLLDPLHNKTDYSYNENDDLTAVIDPRGLATIYTYDGLDYQTEVKSPDTGETTRTFDAAGNVLTSTDARDKVGTYKYDALNRPLTITWTGGETVTYTYDTGTYGIGHLDKMADPAGTTSFTYNQFGQVLTKSQVTGAVTLPVTYTYDAFGRLSTLKYPSGKVITYSYDTSGRVSALSSGAGSIAYFPFGPGKSWTEGNGATYARTFDKDGRITGIALGGTVNVQTLTYDSASHITHLTETGLSAKTYGYDNDDRLTGFVNGTATTSYTYDADGNRTSTITATGTTTYHYPTTSNRLASLSGLTTQTETYDASGNQIGNGTITYDYDARGRMSSSIAGGVTTSYAVNAFGRRIRKIGSDVPNGAANDYVYDEQGHLLGEYNSTGGIVNETVYLADTPVAILTGTGGATVYSVSADWLNAPHIIQNASKQDVWSWDHYAFGDNAPNQNPLDLGIFAYNHRFPGQYKDAETNINYNYFRDYNPTLGRYIESDPLGLAAGINTYGYVSNPLSYTDRTGLLPQWSITLNVNDTLINNGHNEERQWSLTSSGDACPILTGEIVQEVTYTGSYMNLSGNHQVDRSYWEAWSVLNGVIQFNGMDEFGPTPRLLHDTISGTYSVVSSAAFYQNLTLPTGFIANNPETTAGELRSIKNSGITPDFSSATYITNPVPDSFSTSWP